MAEVTSSGSLERLATLGVRCLFWEQSGAHTRTARCGIWLPCHCSSESAACVCVWVWVYIPAVYKGIKARAAYR